MPPRSTFRSLALLIVHSLTSFYIGYITSSIGASIRVKSSANSGRRRLQSEDNTSFVLQIEKCYNYNYFSDACTRDNNEIHRRVQHALHTEKRQVNTNTDEIQFDLGDSSRTSSFLTGSASVPKQDLMEQFDQFGVANIQSNDNEEAILLYNSKDALPGTTSTDNITVVIENCDTLNVQFIHNPSSNSFSMCTLYMPGENNIPSYHVQRWMRNNGDGEMQHVGSLTTPPGVNKFDLPRFRPVISKHWDALRSFIENVDQVLEEVDVIIKTRFELINEKDETVVVMTVNRGDADLLANFLCAAKIRQLDVRRILVFVADEETKSLLESISKSNTDELGVMVYYDKRNVFNMAQGGEGQRYGDATFISMMFAKILCVLFPSLLGYNVLYQDADIVWFANPLDFFYNWYGNPIEEYDIIFQHDGSTQPRFAPYSANSGFYFVRSNSNTQYLFISLLYHGDLIRKTTSHQQVLNHLLLENSSMLGLKVKVLDDVDLFPGGFQYHYDKEYMYKMLAGDHRPLIFHMYWTDGKISKVKFLKQLGEWYVQNDCSKMIMDTKHGITDFDNFCSTEPFISCYYRDKPSKVPCLNSPFYEKNGASFW